jgi:hypothetical protein
MMNPLRNKSTWTFLVYTTRFLLFQIKIQTLILLYIEGSTLFRWDIFIMAIAFSFCVGKFVNK